MEDQHLALVPVDSELVEEQATVNLKMPKSMKDSFKKASKKNNTTMQSVLFALAEDYIENADNMRLKLIRRD